MGGALSAAYLTPTVQRIVRREVLDSDRDPGTSCTVVPGIFNALLSSQPLCFNVFGELAADLPLASRVGSNVTNLVDTVERIEFAWFCRTAEGDRTFIGMEVE